MLLALINQVGIDRDVRVSVNERFVAQRLAINADALVDALEVRARESTRAQAERLKKRIDHSTCRRFAVRTRQLDYAVGVLRVAHQIAQGSDAIK